jgi:hypothetical protein
MTITWGLLARYFLAAVPAWRTEDALLSVAVRSKLGFEYVRYLSLANSLASAAYLSSDK